MAATTRKTALSPKRLVASAIHALTTPFEASDYIDLVAPLQSPVDLRARVRHITPAADNAVTVVLQPGRGWAPHVPGQYVRIGLDIDGVRHWRSYSVVTVPARGADFAITVSRVEDGLVSNYIIDHLQPGTIVELEQAAGDFVVDHSVSDPLLFITGGSGLTPVMGILRSQARGTRDIILVHTARNADAMIYREELQYRAGLGEFTLHTNFSDDAGLLTMDRLSELVPDLDTRSVYVCGPVGLIEAVQDHLETLGRSEFMTTEVFRPRILAVGDGGTVTFEKSDVTVDAEPGQPLLDTGEDAGVLMPSGCRMGVCFGCVAKLNIGAVRDLRTGDLTVADGEDEVMIQTCVSAAAGECHIEL